jgi:hypothetical protein
MEAPIIIALKELGDLRRNHAKILEGRWEKLSKKCSEGQEKLDGEIVCPNVKNPDMPFAAYYCRYSNCPYS